MNYQKIVLVGNVTKDPMQHTSKSGDVSYTTFRVAVSERDEPVYFSVTAFGKQGVLAKQYITKGKEVLVEGRIAISKNGFLDVIADRVVFGRSPDKGIQSELMPEPKPSDATASPMPARDAGN